MKHSLFAGAVVLLCQIPSLAWAQSSPQVKPEKDAAVAPKPPEAPADPPNAGKQTKGEAPKAEAPADGATSDEADDAAGAGTPPADPEEAGENEEAAAETGTLAETGGDATDPETSDAISPLSEEPDEDGEGEAQPGRKSASANQTAEIPEDDYEGATDAALVEDEKRRGDLSLGVALDLTWPMGKAANFIGDASIQGLSLDLRYYAWGNLGVGVGVALDSLSKKTTSTVIWENATITGTQLRELSFTPILAKGYYAWRDQKQFIPYVAAGVGAARTVRRLVVGFSALSEASWHFALVPEAGLQIPAGPTMVLTNVRLSYLPPASGVEDQVFANFSVGLSIQ